MPTIKDGNMYDWVGPRWTPLCGECPHKCTYCFTKDLKRFPAIRAKYSGPLRLEKVFPRMGSGKTWFVGHMTDLFARAVPGEFILRILGHCREWPGNQYVFQTKNPARYLEFLPAFPTSTMLGTTVESDKNDTDCDISFAPPVSERIEAMWNLWRMNFPGETFFTVEPVMDFNLVEFVEMIVSAHADFVNIGADSKRNRLPEPGGEKVRLLISDLESRGVTVRQKPNLKRLLEGKRT